MDLSGAGASSSDKVKFSVNYDGADLEATDFVAEITIGNLDGGQVADGVSVVVQLSIDDFFALETDDVSATAFSEFVGDAGSDGRYEIEPAS